MVRTLKRVCLAGKEFDVDGMLRRWRLVYVNNLNSSGYDLRLPQVEQQNIVGGLFFARGINSDQILNRGLLLIP